MKDAQGNELKVGDRVLVPAVVHADTGAHATGPNITVRLLVPEGEHPHIIPFRDGWVAKAE
jgi:hypothetical protein